MRYSIVVESALDDLLQEIVGNCRKEIVDSNGAHVGAFCSGPLFCGACPRCSLFKKEQIA